ncbi:transmembrane protein 45B-like [Ruditapes philippinarum]|uniref:transmembrane protein 45B-like n=1 Tax=Ruditapes philippinarum TaxID=129788 RepID=UPI00295AB07F|nr:transmembrane protein 45B-like [Ruditapes philippinarum]
MAGSLWGHIDEGLVFITLGLWWLFNVFKRYLRAGGAQQYNTSLSFDYDFKGRKVNFEVYSKIIVPIIGLLIEFFNNGVHVGFTNENGSFKRMSSLQHISIYTLFILSGLIDLLQYKNILVIEGLEYLTTALTFAWYGLIFYFHVTLEKHSSEMSDIVHSLGIVWCEGVAIALVWEWRTVDKFMPNYFRSLMVLCLGTWFFHIPFYLFDSSGFPGTSPNPHWDRNNHANVQFIATMFGFHIVFNITLSLIMYTVMRLVYTRKMGGSKSHVMFHRLANNESELTENLTLLDEEV